MNVAVLLLFGGGMWFWLKGKKLASNVATSTVVQLQLDPFKGEPLFYRNFQGYELRCTGPTNTTIRFEVETPPKL